MTDALIEVVIAVHNPARPIRRAVESVIAGSNSGAVRALVVAHGLKASVIERELAGLPIELYRVIEFADGIPSPAGPFNFGLEQASAEYVSVMGSDDYYEAGFASDYAERLSSAKPDIVVPPLQHANGTYVPSPLPRWPHRANLRADRDRLLYRTAPLAIFKRELLNQAGFVFRPGMRSGEDLAFGVWLWTHASVIRFDRNLPAYTIGDDATDRVTAVEYSFHEIAQPFWDMVAMPWFAQLPLRTRRAVAIKYLRMTVVPLLRSIESQPTWAAEEVAELTRVIAKLGELAPGYTSRLARWEAVAVRALAASPDATQLLSIGRAIAAPHSLASRLTENPFFTLGPEAPLGRILDLALSRREG